MFIDFFSNDVFENTKNYYAVSDKKSQISFKKYIDIIKKFKLYYKIRKLNSSSPNLILIKRENFKLF